MSSSEPGTGGPAESASVAAPSGNVLPPPATAGATDAVPVSLPPVATSTGSETAQTAANQASEVPSPYKQFSASAAQIEQLFAEAATATQVPSPQAPALGPGVPAQGPGTTQGPPQPASSPAQASQPQLQEPQQPQQPQAPIAAPQAVQDSQSPVASLKLPITDVPPPHSSPLPLQTVTTQEGLGIATLPLKQVPPPTPGPLPLTLVPPAAHAPAPQVTTRRALMGATQRVEAALPPAVVLPERPQGAGADGPTIVGASYQQQAPNEGPKELITQEQAIRLQEILRQCLSLSSTLAFAADPEEVRLTASGKIHDRTKAARAALQARGQRSTSKLRGVTHHLRTARWEAHIWMDGKQVYLGSFPDERTAGTAHDMIAWKCRGSASRLNFALEGPAFDAYRELVIPIDHNDVISVLRDFSKVISGRPATSSVYKGVSRHAQGKWEARAPGQGAAKSKYLGLYATEEEAARAYDMALVKDRGRLAKTNFPMSDYAALLVLPGPPAKEITAPQRAGAGRSMRGGAAAAPKKANAASLSKTIAEIAQSMGISLNGPDAGIGAGASAGRGSAAGRGAGRGRGKGRGTVYRPPKQPPLPLGLAQGFGGLAALAEVAAEAEAGPSRQYIGVSQHINGMWVASVGDISRPNYRYLGMYDSADEAARAYDMTVVSEKGLRAKTNFPITDYHDYLPADESVGNGGYGAVGANGHGGYDDGYDEEVDGYSDEGEEEEAASVTVGEDTDPSQLPPLPSRNYKGVYLHSNGIWEASLGKRHIGLFENEEDAARAYDGALIKEKGRRAKTNFPFEEYTVAVAGAVSTAPAPLLAGATAPGPSEVQTEEGIEEPVPSQTYMGVYLHPGGFWEAATYDKDGVAAKHVGMYHTEEEAARAYDEAVIVEFGTAAATNFPLETYLEQAPHDHAATHMGDSHMESAHDGNDMERPPLAHHAHDGTPEPSHGTAHDGTPTAHAHAELAHAHGPDDMHADATAMHGEAGAVEDGTIAEEVIVIKEEPLPAEELQPLEAHADMAVAAEQLQQPLEAEGVVGAEGAEEAAVDGDGDGPAPVPSKQYKGVYLHPDGVCEAVVTNLETGELMHVGLYETEEDAAKAHDEADVAQRGMKADTNFPIRNYIKRRTVPTAKVEAMMAQEAQAASVAKEGKLVAYDRAKGAGPLSPSLATGTKYIGVTEKANGMWEAHVASDDDPRHRYVGVFHSATAAAIAYDVAIVSEFGLAAHTNFPIEQYIEFLPPHEQQAVLLAQARVSNGGAAPRRTPPKRPRGASVVAAASHASQSHHLSYASDDMSEGSADWERVGLAGTSKRARRGGRASRSPPRGPAMRAQTPAMRGGGRHGY